MASVQDRVSDQVNLAIEKAARKLYRQNVKLSPEEISNLIELHLYRLLDEKNIVKGLPSKTKTLAYLLAHGAVSEVDSIKK